jgi:hypothetical protein
MLVKTQIKYRHPLQIEGKSTRWKYKDVDLTGEYRCVCIGRKCYDEVETTYEQKTKRVKRYPRRFWFDKHVETWETETITRFVTIDDLEIGSIHDHYVETVEKEL